MHSNLLFFNHNDNSPSDCGNVLDIEFSSRELDWQGIVFEKGQSPHFYPDNVHTPYFYFALALEQDLSWQVETSSGTQSLKSTPGNIWINPPQTPFTHEISEPCYFLILAIEPEPFFANCPLPLNRDDLQFLNNYNVVDETIKGIMELFMIEAENKGRNGRNYLQNLLSLLSTHHIQNYSNYQDLLAESSKKSKFSQVQIAKVDDYIASHIGEPIAVEDLAELLHCSKFYFLREFKKLMSVTPYQYLMAKRLEHAKSQLSQPNAHIASVAMALGFNDQAHFTRAFKAQFNQTPGQFLKSIKR